MSVEDAQPNDLRGRSHMHNPIPSIRTSHSLFQSNLNTRFSVPGSSKRRPDALTPSSPVKRRRLNNLRQKEIIKTLPQACRKGVPGCHRERKQFLAREIESLKESGMGLQVVGYTVAGDHVVFSCEQDDLINCSLAPLPDPVREARHAEKDESAWAEELAPRLESPPLTAASSFRCFSSGRLVFKLSDLIFPGESTRKQVAVPDNVPRRSSSEILVVDQESARRSPRPRVHSSSHRRTATPEFLQPLSIASSSSDLPEIDPDPYPGPNVRDDDDGDKLVIPSIAAATVVLTYSTEGAEFRIPARQQYDKLRRYLCGSATSSLPVVVSMYGTLERVDPVTRRHFQVAQVPSPSRDVVDDACLLEQAGRTAVVLGHNRDVKQLSLVRFDQSGRTAEVAHLNRPWSSSKKGGVSAVAHMMAPRMFATGGYDHMVHLWTATRDFASAAPQVLNMKHTSQIQSLLAIQDTSHKLVSASADCSVNFWDLSSERVAHTLKTSNSVYHAHRTLSSFCTLLEVAHRELQFEVRDHRCVPTVPVQRFGHTEAQLAGRYAKSASLENFFVSGSRDGVVRVWDLRRPDEPRETIKCFEGQKIVQMFIHSSSRFVACSEHKQFRVISAM